VIAQTNGVLKASTRIGVISGLNKATTKFNWLEAPQHSFLKLINKKFKIPTMMMLKTMTT
jgi:hypothetical protein